MLPEDDRVRLQHMLDAARKAVRLAVRDGGAKTSTQRTSLCHTPWSNSSL